MDTSCPKIEGFSGPHRFLSNFWPVQVTFEGHEYTSVEHAYVAAKVTDPAARQVIREASTAGKAKRMGRMLTLRPDWEDVKLDIMTQLLAQKFSHQKLGELLLSTGDAELIETNTWGDVFWGVCKGVGKNHLGRILMEVRTALRGC